MVGSALQKNETRKHTRPRLFPAVWIRIDTDAEVGNSRVTKIQLDIHIGSFGDRTYQEQLFCLLTTRKHISSDRELASLQPQGQNHVN